MTVEGVRRMGIEPRLCAPVRVREAARRTTPLSITVRGSLPGDGEHMGHRSLGIMIEERAR